MKYKDYVKDEPQNISINVSTNYNDLQSIEEYYKAVRKALEERKNDKCNIQNNE